MKQKNTNKKNNKQEFSNWLKIPVLREKNLWGVQFLYI